MVTVLSGPRAPLPEPGLHLALATGADHALPALLATETPDRVPAFHVSGANDGRNNRQKHQEKPGDGDRSQNAVEHAAQTSATVAALWLPGGFAFGMSDRTMEALNHTTTAE